MRKCIFLILILILLTVGMMTAAQSDESPTPEPITPTPTTAPLALDPLLGISIEPPLDITLPDGWVLVLRDTYTYRDLVPDDDGELETLPMDVYVGPVSNEGVGWIVMLWGYDTLVPFTENMSEAEYYERAAWLNGLRMLQFVVFDSRCNIGTAPQREYTIGGLAAIGTTFSAVNCPFEQPDTRGWFAAMNIDNLNFAFFAYADPIQPAGSVVEFELQSIIDSVEFRVEDITISGDAFRATSEALILTPRPTIFFPTAAATATP